MISGHFVVLTQNCLTSTLDYIAMRPIQMRKINCEKDRLNTGNRINTSAISIYSTSDSVIVV